VQSVKESWYTFYSWLLTGIGAVALAVSLLAFFAGPAKGLQSHGFNTIALVISLTAMLFRLVGYGYFVKKYEQRMATFAMHLIILMLCISLVNSTGQLRSPFELLWLMLLFFGGMFGGYMILSFELLISMYLLLLMTNTPGHITFKATNLIIIAVSYGWGVVSYLIWRRMYIDKINVQIAKLSGALKSNQQQAEILLQSITDGVVVTDIEGKISLFNPAAAALTGWSIDEATGLDVQLVLKFNQEDGKELEEDQYPFRTVTQSNQPVKNILQLVNKTNANNKIVSLVISPIILPKTSEAVGAVAVIRDVSEQRVEEHRRADFISTASHEMRTPVAAIEGYLALALNDKVTRIDSKARDYLEKAHESTQHLGQLFQDLLTSAKAEDGRLVNHPTVVEMGAYLEQLTDGLRFAAEKKGLLLDFTVGTSERPTSGSAAGDHVIRPLYYAYIDPDRMREVITNLFDNAVKYTEAGKISVGLTGNDEVIQFYIHDTGHGIPSEDIPHLFQKFYRVDNTATRTVGGTGLGLFICRKIVELYHGRIWVESEVGKGSTFYINIPRLSSQKAMELQQQEAQKTV
jgi:PAS domain S-box-containing protein